MSQFCDCIVHLYSLFRGTCSEKKELRRRGEAAITQPVKAGKEEGGERDNIKA